MKRAEAAKMLGEMLRTGVVGLLLDEVGDADLRDKVLKACIRAREISVDAESAETMANVGGKIAPGVCVGMARQG